MTWATHYFVDADVHRPMDHRDTIVASGNNTMGYFHYIGFTNVNAIGVGAISRSLQPKV